MNRVVWLVIFSLILPPCAPLSSVAGSISASPGFEGSGADGMSGAEPLLLAGRDDWYRYQRRREIRRDIRRHYRKKQRRKQRKAAVAGAIVGGVVVGGIMAERARKRRAYEDALRDHHRRTQHDYSQRYDYDY